MGHIFALCGCSGVGKTTLLNRLAGRDLDRLIPLTRSTTRSMRKGEQAGVDYDYRSREEFLRRLSANDYVHVEQNQGHYFGVDALEIDNLVASDSHGIIMAGWGAQALKVRYPKDSTVLFLHTGDRQGLLDSASLDIESAGNLELARRLREKIDAGVLLVPAAKDRETVVQGRMQENLLVQAYFSGQIRSRAEITVLANERDQLDAAVDHFGRIRAQVRRGQRVLGEGEFGFIAMPYQAEFDEIYDKHIWPAVQGTGLAGR